MLTKKQITFLREELATAKNPLFFYDSDGDGLASFLLLYRINKEGKGYRVTTSSSLNESFMRRVEEWNPDKIFILDIPNVDQEFLDKAKRPVFWIDHHKPQERQKVHYYNPRIKNPDAYIPTSRMCYQVSDQDLWLATAGSLADWHMPSFISKFIKKHKYFLNKKKDLPNTVFKSKVGMLVKLLFFIQKGPSKEVTKAVKVLTRINSPEEIFNEETSQGKFIHRRFIEVNKRYEDLFKEAKKSVTRSKLILFYYNEQKWSFTANLANELMARHQSKYIIIARLKSGSYKCSLRGKNVATVLEQALQGVSGHGGGHPDACGAVVDEQDWDVFLKEFKRGIK